jgi:hypothetical protein
VDTSNTLKHKSVQRIEYADDKNIFGGRFEIYYNGKLSPGGGEAMIQTRRIQ